ncbi:hypothetical protein HanRHA438_Chr11g0516311 [Helianthus annuus]|nr:hypothetical protein HanIR_Chr11g0542171 [Helianthus annuus]KAJ0871778.1 hypothetical protein HanRHA438_Chr11g0516311 [Helianthus annuus]
MQLDQMSDAPNRRTHHLRSHVSRCRLKFRHQTYPPSPTTTGDSDAESSDINALRSTGLINTVRSSDVNPVIPVSLSEQISFFIYATKA